MRREHAALEVVANCGSCTEQVGGYGHRLEVDFHPSKTLVDVTLGLA
jgi:hypothetical protein